MRLFLFLSFLALANCFDESSDELDALKRDLEIRQLTNELPTELDALKRELEIRQLTNELPTDCWAAKRLIDSRKHMMVRWIEVHCTDDGEWEPAQYIASEDNSPKIWFCVDENGRPRGEASWEKPDCGGQKKGGEDKEEGQKVAWEDFRHDVAKIQNALNEMKVLLDHYDPQKVAHSPHAQDSKSKRRN